MALSNFGQQFAVKTLRKFYQTAVTPAVTNTNYEGEIKQAGDRVNILSFLNDITLNDYVAGTDMAVESIVDAQDQLVVEKRKYYSFPIDRLEDLFTYADDISDTLVENASKVLERVIDSYVLQNANNAKAGNWVGINLRMNGNGADTGASVATTAAGGTITIQAGTVNGDGTIENPIDGLLYYIGFTSADVGLPIRLTSGTAWATEWYKIASVTNSTQVAVVNWDGATSGSDIPNGDILRGLHGGSDFTSNQNGDSYPDSENGWGFEIQGAIATTVSKTTIYQAITDVAEKLNNQEVPDTDRHLTVTPYVYKILEQASELQPAVAMAYDPIVINGKVGRVLGFDVHLAAGTRVSTRAGHSNSTGQGADSAPVAGALGYQILANHISGITFAYKWAESRIVDAENQFAKKYQGLHLFGALVPALRRKAVAQLFAAI
jgi:hypothetical protein